MHWATEKRLKEEQALKKLEEIVIDEYRQVFNDGILEQFDAISDLPSYSGVYFIIRNESLIYIGRSVNIRRRFANHYNYQEGDEIQCWPIAADELRWLEWACIAIFKPKENRRFYLGSNFLKHFNIEKITGVKYIRPILIYPTA